MHDQTNHRIGLAGWDVATAAEREMLNRQMAAAALVPVAQTPADQFRPISDRTAAAEGTTLGTSAVYAFGDVTGDLHLGANVIRFLPDRHSIGFNDPNTHFLGERRSFVVTSGARKAALIASGVPPETVHVVPPGIDAEVWAPISLEQRINVRRDLGFDDTALVLLNVAESLHDDGIDVLIKAFARAHKLRPTLRLLLRGAAYHDAQAYTEMLQKAFKDERCLSLETLEAIRTVPGGFSSDIIKSLYNASDCLVVPTRALLSGVTCLEAVAAGLPIICTADRGFDENLNDHLAWRVRGELAESGLSEPDPRELTDALLELADGRCFDRIRYSSSRMALLRQFTWVRSGQLLRDVLMGEDTAQARITSPRSLPALTPCCASLATTGIKLTTDRRLFSRNREERLSGAALSVVVQGPCVRRRNGENIRSLDDTVQSIRNVFPQAQIIVSTWDGSDIEGLGADDVVLNPDPGAITDGRGSVNNFNRMIQSTASGLSAASRPFCIKTRSDVQFTSNKLASCELGPAARHLCLDRRIWCGSHWTARLETYLRPFHASDMVQFGLTDDLRQLWNVLPSTMDETFDLSMPSHLPRLVPEQALLTKFLRNNGIDVVLNNSVDGRREIVELSIETLLSTFDVYDEVEAGVDLSPHHSRAFPFLRETALSFADQRDRWQKDPGTVYNDCFEAIQTKYRQLATGRFSIFTDPASISPEFVAA
jgi:glycosyltransferase involved in cell wall biosynthesis